MEYNDHPYLPPHEVLGTVLVAPMRQSAIRHVGIYIFGSGRKLPSANQIFSESSMEYNDHPYLPPHGVLGTVLEGTTNGNLSFGTSVFISSEVTGTDKVKGENFSLINRLPDNDTMEIVLFGTAYPDVKAAIFRLDRLQAILERRGDANLKEILKMPSRTIIEVSEVLSVDPEKKYVMEDARYAAAAKVRKHLEIVAAIRWCQNKKSLVRMYGRLIGAQEQGTQIRASKEQIKTWRNAILQVAKEPLEFETVRDDYDI